MRGGVDNGENTGLNDRFSGQADGSLLNAVQQFATN